MSVSRREKAFGTPRWCSSRSSAVRNPRWVMGHECLSVPRLERVLEPGVQARSIQADLAGIDRASEKHDVLIEDAVGEPLLAATFVHDEDGVSALCAALECFEVEVAAIERPERLLVDRLLGRRSFSHAEAATSLPPERPRAGPASGFRPRPHLRPRG